MGVNSKLARFKYTIGQVQRLVLPCFLFHSTLCHAATTPYDLNLAFYYGANPPLNQLKLFKNIVVEPSSGVDPAKLQTDNRKIFAYVSLGEATGLNQYTKPIDPSWVVAKNDAWHSIVLDQSNPAWQEFFLDSIITPLWDQGYRGFFLDTLDSFRFAAKTPEQMQKQQAGMIATIKSIKEKYPEAKLITNRGFEILPQIRPLVDEVITESLFHGWDNKNKRYFIVPEDERKKLLVELNKVKEMGLPITIVDYIAPNHPAEAKEAAQQISGLGFNPWITNGDLTEIYIYNVELLPRKILLLYQGKLNDVDEKIGSYVSKSVTMPLNYLGYVTILRNIQEPLPQDISPQEYAGIVVAADGFLLGREQELYQWYLSQFKKQIPLVILNQFGFPADNHNLEPFGLAMPLFTYYPKSLQTIYKAPMAEYEISPSFKPNNFLPVTVTKGTSLLKVTDENGTPSDVAAITPWGGYYLSSNFLVPISTDYRWSIDPFQFFKQTLRLKDMPVPDTTSENGNRLMFVHIDGDGFANRAEWYKGPFVGEVMRKEFLERYLIPTTVSIVQGEIASNGLHPELADQLEKIARQIFALPNVELASHTFSHPFNWRLAARYDYAKSKFNPNTLPIPNYRFNLETEITGSVNYINDNLAPPHKKCKIFLWSGEGDVPEKALELVYKAGLANINPGTIVTKLHNSIARVPSLGLFAGPYFQVFVPIGNDNETINNSPIFYSLINIIDALKLTDSPRRLKPIDIYIHFYTVSQKGGINALHQVYDWALSNPVMNIFTSDYFNKVIDFNQLLVAKKEDGWLFETNDSLREFRIPRSMGYPDLTQSTNVIGYSTYNDDVYIHAGPGGEAFIKLTKEPAPIPYLMNANGRITRFQRINKGFAFSVDSYTPVTFTIANMQSCNVWEGKNKLAEKGSKDNAKEYALKETKYDLSIRCE